MQDLLAHLNQAQRQAVTHGAGPLLIVAGAGTGKTTVLTRRYLYLLENWHREAGVGSPESDVAGKNARLTTDNLLALTFTEKAAAEMEDRILQLLPNGAYDFWISTFHSFCQRMLEQYAFEIGLPTRFSVFNETDAWLLAKRHVDELPLNYYRPLGNPAKFLAGLLKHFSRAKDEGVTPERYLEFAAASALDGDAEFVSGERARLTEIADCYFAYRRLLREAGAMDFGDLIVETLRLLRERPRVLAELRNRFKFVLVDEFQDTNWAQYELIKLIAGERRNLTVVGDDDQSIYKFRGASLANILQFRDDYPDAITVSLTENYRSRQEILDTAYRFIQSNDPNRLEVQLCNTGLTKRLTGSHGSGGQVVVVWYKTLEDEAEGVAMRLLDLKAKDSELCWNDCAILSRSNDGAEPFIRALERHGIPFQFFAQRGLYAKPAILDLTAFFSLFDGYHEASAVWRVLTAPCYAFGARDLATWLQYASRKGISVWEAVRLSRAIAGLSEETVKSAERCVSQIQNLAETARREKPLKLLQLTLEKTGYLASVMRLPEQDKVETINLLNAFAHRISRYEHSTHAPSLPGFLDELRLEIFSGEEGALAPTADDGPEMVRVMTIHGSKGLEFTHVFIVSLVDQRLPTRARGEEIPLPDGLVNERLPQGDTHLEEERRLFYVALTRAKQSVTLTGAEAYGGARSKKPSSFLAEAGLELTHAPDSAQSQLLLLAPSEEQELAQAAERVIFPLKRRFSFTQLAAFRTCPLQYKFAHVYRIPILGSFHKSFGQSIHLALHDILALHVERGKTQQASLFDSSGPAPIQPNRDVKSTAFRVTLDEALQIYQTRWIDEWYSDRVRHDQYFQEGKAAIQRLVESWQTSTPSVACLEQPFDWRIGEHSIKGSVDRIDYLPDGGQAIFDYKTGAPKTAQALETGDKEQLWIYQLAMEGRGLDIRHLAYIYVRSSEIATVPILQGAKRQEFQLELLARMDDVLKSKFPAKPSSYTCRFCDFKNICEFRKL